MKNLKTLSFFFITLFIFNLSCSKDDDSVKEQETGEGFDYTQETINIVLPAGSELNFTNYKVRSIVDDFNINSNGGSTANFLENSTSIAYVLDKNENAILAGFINSEKREISVRSTVEVSLYFNLGTVFLPSEIKEIYIKEISTGINIDETANNCEPIFASNPNLIGSESFLAEIQALTKKFIESKDDFSEQSKTSSGIKFKNISKSGIRLVEEPGNKILFRNTIRRRAHAFLYKTKTESENGQETIVINDIVGENTVTSTQVIIPPTTAVTSVIGLLQTVVSGKGLEIGAINSEPTILTIADDNDAKETYQARVVGPGKLTTEGLTDEEAQKLLELNIETFAFDMLLPIITTVIGLENSKVFKSSDPAVADFVSEVTKAIGNLNGANDAAKTGDFRKLLISFIEGMGNSTTASAFEPMLKSAIKAIATSAVDSSGRKLLPAARDKLLKGVSKLFKALKIADITLQGIDILRVSYAIGNSKPVVNFEIIVNRGKVSLEPFSTKTKTGDEDVLYTAEVHGQDLEPGQAFEYVWTSTGDEGILVAVNKDETHPTTITTSVNQIKYRAQGSNGNDEIKVEVYIKQGVNRTRVDDEIATVDVLDFRMKITPNNATISGGTHIDLSVVDENGKDFSQSDVSEYSFIWKTTGIFGKFNGTRNTVDQNTNPIRYEALERTQEGIENISVSVYRKAKGSNESFRFLQSVEGTININNDPKKKYLVLGPIFTENFYSIEGCGIRNLIYKSFYVNKVPNAKSYRLEVTDAFTGPGPVPNLPGGPIPDFTRTWNNSNGPTMYPNIDPHEDVSDYDFRINLNSASSNTCNSIYDKYATYVSGTKGTAQLIIILE